MYDGYRTIQKRYFSQAVHIVDLFHVITQLTNAVNRIRTSAMKNCEDGSLEYTDATKFLGITLRDAFYCYTPQKGETIADIKKKFGIKDGVIKALNGISDEEYCPAQHNKQIYFRLSE